MATEIHIHLDAGRLNFPLRTIWQGVLSSAVIVIHGVPVDIDGLGVVFGVAPSGNVPHDPPTFRAAATRQADGTWRAYCMPAIFPVVGLELVYSVVGLDANESPRWLGTGQLNVVDCPAAGSSDAPEVVPADTYIRNPVTGKYHLLTAELDADGHITLNLADEGIER
ncbi:MAG: hypothetical protein J6V72_09200 [Kiritimatiellae bacterium]|nr:hypothetical protein [Kiritimatiellia bacterium]